jgi:manganese/zinc/iron transport system ATP- binding protein
MEKLIDIHNVSIAYSGKPVVWEADFFIPNGVIAGIIGPNGGGKTSILKAIMGIIPYHSGEIQIFHQKIDQVRDRIAYVPQRETVDWDFPIQVKEVVMMGRYNPNKFFQRFNANDKKIVAESLEKVGLSNFANNQISKLSGGQQQRVFIARALAQEADILILDEPFAAVDTVTENAILTILQQLKNEGKTIVMVHHDLHSGKDFFDWVVMLNTRIVAFGKKEDVFTEENLKNTYGAKLHILNKVADELKRQEFSNKMLPK